MPSSESMRHRELKRLALAWAQAQGYRAAAAEVSLPNMRFRLDVAAYKPAQIREYPARGGRARTRSVIGHTAVFECKASRTDYLRDARSLVITTDRLKHLHAQKLRIEEELRLHYPSILNGDSLFPEYHSVDYRRPGHERYLRTLEAIRRMTGRLHANTKFDKLVQWGAANLFWLVADPGTMPAEHIPAGWGLLTPVDGELRVAIKPLLHDIAEPDRLSLFHRIALAATRAVNREHGIVFDSPFAQNSNTAAAPPRGDFAGKPELNPIADSQ